MSKMKAAVIGAGSSYTPEIMEGFIQRAESLPFTEFYLMDINKEKLETVGGLASRMLAAANHPAKLVLTQDLDEALTGADYVFAQIRVGGMAARIRDEKIPLKHGLLGQETTGAGGFMNAMRTVPVMMDLARRMEKLAPNAWLINFSNPSGIIAEAILNHTKVKMVGLCNNPVNMLAGIEKALGSRDFEYQYVGLNHLSWITSVTHQGKEVLTDLDGAQSVMKNVPDIDYPDELLAAVPGIPCAYLSYFYMRDRQVKKLLEQDKTRGEVCVELEASLMDKYKNPDLSIKPVELESRGGALYSTAAVSLADAIHNGRDELHVVNTLNKGAIPFMADDDVVEVKCRVGRDGTLTPQPIGAFRNQYIVGLMQAVKAYEKLAVSAAMNGSRADALAALMVHPLIGDYDKASAVLEEMLEANAEYLPQFMGKA